MPAMDIHTLINRNRLPRKQKGEIIETRTTFFARYYHTAEDGTRKQKAVKLCEKSDLYRSKTDVQPLMDRLMESVNAGQGSEIITGQESLSDFMEKHYFPWCEVNKSAPTVNGYKQIWNCYLKPHLSSVALVNLTTAQVTAVLTHLAKNGGRKKTGLGRYALSHVKFVLSGVYEYAIATGVIPMNTNPALGAKWLHKVPRPAKQTEYALDEVLSMLRILEPVDIRAAVAVGLAYFASLRPAEIRGLQWAEWDGEKLHIKRTVWRNLVGETKTESSVRDVTVIEPLRGLLERFRAQSADGFMLQSSSGKPLSLDSLNVRVIAPAMKTAGIEWRGYYPGRRGFSSLMTDTSGNILNATGHLGHANPATTLGHYTKPQRKSIDAALETIEQLATRPAEPKVIQ
jgi:integrase